MELIKIKDNNTVDLRMLFNELEINGRFRDWVKRTVIPYGFEEGTDYTKIETIINGGTSFDYEVSLDMAKELCMIAKS